MNWGDQSSSGCRQWGGSSVLINEMSLIQGEKIISTAIGQTWDMTPGSSTCQINNTPLILSSYPIKPFSCSWVLWAMLTQDKEGSWDKRRSSDRRFAASGAFWESLYWLLVCQEETLQMLSQPWSWCWDLSISEPSVSKPCGPAAWRGESGPRLLLL